MDFVFLQETECWDLSKIDFKQYWYNFISPFPSLSFSFPWLMCDMPGWDNGGRKQCCEGDKRIKQDSSEAAEGKWGKQTGGQRWTKWEQRTPGLQSMVSRKKVKTTRSIRIIYNAKNLCGQHSTWPWSFFSVLHLPLPGNFSSKWAMQIDRYYLWQLKKKN